MSKVILEIFDKREPKPPRDYVWYSEGDALELLTHIDSQAAEIDRLRAENEYLKGTLEITYRMRDANADRAEKAEAELAQLHKTFDARDEKLSTWVHRARQAEAKLAEWKEIALNTQKRVDASVSFCEVERAGLIAELAEMRGALKLIDDDGCETRSYADCCDKRCREIACAALAKGSK